MVIRPIAHNTGILRILTGCLLLIMLFAGLACFRTGLPAQDVRNDDATGQVKISCGGPGELILKSTETGSRQTYASANSTFVVPAGKYQLYYYSCLLKDEEGHQWRARSSLASRDDAVFTLRAGRIKHVEAGPPFEASVKVTTKADRQTSLDLQLVGKGKDKCLITCLSRKAPNPSFLITDKKGSEVLSGSFEYG